MKQYAAAGLKFPVVTGETGGDDALLHSFGDEAIGMHSCCPYTSDLPTDANKRFISGMEKNFNVLPGFYAAGLYVNCQVVEAGLKNNGGKSDDKAKLMAARVRVLVYRRAHRVFAERQGLSSRSGLHEQAAHTSSG